MMKKNQLTRALRIDKFTAAALEMVLQEYLSEEKAVRNIPVLRMITSPLKDVKWEAEDLCRILNEKDLPAKIECVQSTYSVRALRVADRRRFPSP